MDHDGSVEGEGGWGVAGLEGKQNLQKDLLDSGLQQTNVTGSIGSVSMSSHLLFPPLLGEGVDHVAPMYVTAWSHPCPPCDGLSHAITRQ